MSVSSLIDRVSLARSLGLQDDLKIAIELQRVTLAQPDQVERALSGPILLCQTAERLILLAHDGAQLRQKPWAFTPPNLLEVRPSAGGLSLRLQGGRQINIQVDPSLIEPLKAQLERWRVSV